MTKIDKRDLSCIRIEKNLVRSLTSKEILFLSRLLSYKGVSTPISDLSILFYSLIKNDPPNVVKLREVLPIEYSKKRKVRHYYKRIKVEELSSERIEDFYYNLNFKKLPFVTELSNFFMIFFQPKPPILISKENGRLYTLEGKWDIEEVQHQGSLVMRVLESVDLVEGWKRKTILKKKRYK